MCAFSSYAWSHDKDGGHTIQSAVFENPMLHAKFMALCFIEPELLLIECLHCGNRDFQPLLLLWPWPIDLHIWIWTSYVKAFESYRLTDIHTDRQTDKTKIIHHTTLWVVSNLSTNASLVRLIEKPTKLCGSSLHGGDTYSHCCVFFTGVL